MNLLNDLGIRVKGISVYAFIGASGTGKSFRARLVAQKYGISAIIDDGLLIQGDKIAAGHSAKREQTYMGAVRAALFDDKEHRDEVARALRKLRLKKLLILGTSEKMVIKIATRLQLPPPEKFVHIEDIATADEIAQALRCRQVEGKHVIPVPAHEIKRNYPKIFNNAVRIIQSHRNLLDMIGIHFEQEISPHDKIYEKSVVRPEFSRKGRINISQAALAKMTTEAIGNFDSDVRIKRLAIRTDANGYRFILTIDVPFGMPLAQTINKLQQYIIDTIENFTGILIEEVSVIIDRITPRGNLPVV
jgi:hypothetical protein